MEFPFGVSVPGPLIIFHATAVFAEPVTVAVNVSACEVARVLVDGFSEIATEVAANPIPCVSIPNAATIIAELRKVNRRWLESL